MNPRILESSTPRILEPSAPAHYAITLLILLLTGCEATPWGYDYLRNVYFAVGPETAVTVEKHPSGLADAAITVETGQRRFIVYGFRFHDVDQTPITPIEAHFSARASRLTIEHRFEGGRTVTATLSLDKTGLLRTTFDRIDRIGHITSGRLDTKLDILTFDYGWVFKRPGKFQRDRIMSDFFLGTDLDNSHLLLACINGKRILVDPGAQTYAWQTRHRPNAATYVFGIADDAAKLIARYKTLRNHQPTPHAKTLVARHLLDDWTSLKFDQLVGLIDALRFANADRLVYIRHRWQQHGYDTKLPDTFPPNEEYGGLAALKILAEHCKHADIPFALHENFFDLYEDAPSFADFTCAYQPREWSGGSLRPYLGWMNRATGQRARVHTPGSARAAMNRNLTLQTQNLPVSAAFLDVTSYSDPLSLNIDDQPTTGQPTTGQASQQSERSNGKSDQSGETAPPPDSLTLLRKLHADAGQLVEGPVLGEGCTEKFIGVVDGANLDLWAHDRWDNDPRARDWDFSPALAWLAHDALVFHAAGYPPRFKKPQQAPLTPEMYASPFIDDYRSASILFGSAPASFLTDKPYSRRLPDILREYFLGVPFHRHVGLVSIVNVTHPDRDIHRTVVTYANGAVVHVNRSPKNWKVGQHLLPQFGYRVQHDDFLQLAALRDGHRLDLVRDKDLLYVDMRGKPRSFGGLTTAGRLAVLSFDDRCEIVPIADIDSVHIDFADFVVSPENVARIELIAPDGTTEPVTHDGQDLIVTADQLRRPNKTNAPHAPPYKKILMTFAKPRSSVVRESGLQTPTSGPAEK